MVASGEQEAWQQSQSLWHLASWCGACGERGTCSEKAKGGTQKGAGAPLHCAFGSTLALAVGIGG